MLSYLNDLFQSNPFVSAIDLSGKGLASLDHGSLALLSRFSELRRLDLSDNAIRRLPKDLSIFLS